MTNLEVASILERIADLLQLSEETLSRSGPIAMQPALSAIFNRICTNSMNSSALRKSPG